MIEHAYIHIPFCIRKCHYCSFVSGFDIKEQFAYINALKEEIKTRYKNEKLKTIYFGGGTPSLMDTSLLSEILSLFNKNTNCEITIEINPETVSLQKLKEIKASGYNRISLGIQSFSNTILKTIGRLHTEEAIYSAIRNIKEAGFKNVSIDLIYGLPNQTKELFLNDLNKAVSLDIQHISTYGLKIEEESYFGKHPPINLPNDEDQAEMFLILCDFLKKKNFEHYEISNFSKIGFRSNHNCAYWKNKNYYGFGLNASGYEGNIRYKNTSKFKEYLQTPLKREEEEILTVQETMENEIFLALRLKEGINIEHLNKKYNIDFEKKYKDIIKKYTNLELLKIDSGNCHLTKKGILLSNNIMSEFLD